MLHAFKRDFENKIGIFSRKIRIPTRIFRELKIQKNVILAEHITLLDRNGNYRIVHIVSHSIKTVIGCTQGYSLSFGNELHLTTSNISHELRV